MTNKCGPSLSDCVCCSHYWCFLEFFPFFPFLCTIMHSYCHGSGPLCHDTPMRPLLMRRTWGSGKCAPRQTWVTFLRSTCGRIVEFCSFRGVGWHAYSSLHRLSSQCRLGQGNIEGFSVQHDIRFSHLVTSVYSRIHNWGYIFRLLAPVHALFLITPTTITEL